MVSMDFSFSMRLLSWVYVNIWIPIRLTYLRAKIALRPVTNVACEILALQNMIWCCVPISMMMILAEILNALSKEWLRLVCLGYEKAIGIEPGSLYEKHISLERMVQDDDVNEAGDELKNADTSDDKNMEEEALNEPMVPVTAEEKTIDEPKEE